MLAARNEAGHKGTFGMVLVVGGQSSPQGVMLGAPALAARAALRVGCGRCVIAAPAPILPAILTLCPSATGVPLPARDAGLLPGAGEALLAEARGEHAAVIGPGLGQGAVQRDLVRTALAHLTCPIVLDADGLNAMTTADDAALIARHGRVVLTPHPGEFRRLAGAFGIGTLDEGDGASRKSAASALAHVARAVVVLKGATTIVASPDGRAQELSEANAVMAVGGSGDVLAGAIAGLLAQYPDARGGALADVVRAGVLAHASAGRAWRDSAGVAGGMLAWELADHLPRAVQGLRKV
ncbi:MAG: NAD(P)H-hydrate dehydratase [bacterium]